MSVFCLKSFIFNAQYIYESTIFQKWKSMENNLTKGVLVFFNRQCNTTAFQISCTVNKENYSAKQPCKRPSFIQGQNQKHFFSRHGGTSKGWRKIRTFPPGPLLAVTSAITAGPQNINRWLLAWDSTPGSSSWGLMYQTCLDHSPELKPTGLELPKSVVLNWLSSPSEEDGWIQTTLQEHYLACAVSEAMPMSCLEDCELVLAKRTPGTTLTTL